MIQRTLHQDPLVQLVWITPEAEKHMAYCARVSNPTNQNNEDSAKLLSYCAKNKHWSVFEMATMCLEMNTTRAISAQLLRHAFNFQEFSQRYQDITELGIDCSVVPRRQDTKNRQNSIEDLSDSAVDWFQQELCEIAQNAHNTYTKALEMGIAKESARFLLPMATQTRLYVSGTLRQWIHYCQVRTHPSTQKEHQILARLAQIILLEQCPALSTIFLEETTI